MFEPSVAQPPLPLQVFLPLQPWSLDLQPPCPLQSFLPLQECLGAGVCWPKLRPALVNFAVWFAAEFADWAATVAPPVRPARAAVKSRAFS